MGTYNTSCNTSSIKAEQKRKSEIPQGTDVSSTEEHSCNYTGIKDEFK